jgi:hypothetical protein
MRKFSQYLIDVIATTVFSYLLLASMFVLWFGGPFSRIDLLGFLIPHTTKVMLWSFVALIWLRPRFGWRFPFAMFFLYCSSELLTNGIWFAVHIPFGYKPPADFAVLFSLSTLFFIMGVGLSYLFLKGQFDFRKDWSMLPFSIFVASWVLMGYQTESTIVFPSYWLEAQEFIWNALYLLMAVNVFVRRDPTVPQ